MVRVNLIHPKKLADQHLIAEYNEILMLFAYVRKHPKGGEIPKSYRLGKGHILFFKDKLRYLKNRHELLKVEMRKRGFETNKSIDLDEFEQSLVNDWKHSKGDEKIIIQRIAEKIQKKPEYYTYEGEKKGKDFFIGLLH